MIPGRLLCSEQHLMELVSFTYKPTAADLQFKGEVNNPKHRLTKEQLSPRVLNHWLSQGLIEDGRTSGTGWHLFSDSDLIWIRILTKLRRFGMSLDKLVVSKNMIEFQRDPKSSTRPFLDFYLYYITTKGRPVSILVFETGEIEFGTPSQIEFSIQSGDLSEDYISIDLARIAGLAHKVSWLSSAKTPSTKSAAAELLKDGASSVTIESKSGKYVLSSKKRFDNRTAALAEKSLMKFGEMREILTNGKSKFELTKSTIIRK